LSVGERVEHTLSQLGEGKIRQRCRQTIFEPVTRDPWNVDVAATRVKPLREQIELLRAIGKAMKQDDDVLDRRAMFVEARPCVALKRRVGGVARNDRANRSNRSIVRERRRNGRQRPQIARLRAACNGTCRYRRADGRDESAPIHVSAPT
jgi:hypothetical protein